MKNKVLVYDEDIDILNIIQMVLEMDNFKVLPLKDKNTIIEKAKVFKPNVAILDYELKGEVCICVTKKLKTIFENLPIVVMSCNNNIEESCKKEGYSDYLKKPFDIDNLSSTIKRNLKKNKMGLKSTCF